MKNAVIAAVVLGAAGWLSGCNSGLFQLEEPDFRWENPAIAEEVWENHRDECRRLAETKAEREYRTLYQPDLQNQFGRSTTLQTKLARFDAARRREDLFTACMRDRGFRRMKEDEES